MLQCTCWNSRVEIKRFLRPESPLMGQPAALLARMASSMFHNDAAMQVSTSRWRMAKMKHHSLHFDDEHECPSVFDMPKSPELS